MLESWWEPNDVHTGSCAHVTAVKNAVRCATSDALEFKIRNLWHTEGNKYRNIVHSQKIFNCMCQQLSLPVSLVTFFFLTWTCVCTWGKKTHTHTRSCFSIWKKIRCVVDMYKYRWTCRSKVHDHAQMYENVVINSWIRKQQCTLSFWTNLLMGEFLWKMVRASKHTFIDHFIWTERQWRER